jgi:predicted ATPase
MKAHFGNEQCTTQVVAKHEEEEKMKADKESIDNEEFNRKAFKLLQSSGNEEANTSNGGGSVEEDWDHFSEALQRHSNLKTTLHPWDLLATNHCSRNHIWQQQRI